MNELFTYFGYSRDMTEFIMPHMPSRNVSLLFSFQYLVYHQTHGIYHATYIGGGENFFWGEGGSSDETEIAEGKRMLKPPFCALHCICCKKWGLCPQPPLPALPPMTYRSHVSCLFLLSPYARLLFSFKYLVYHQIYHICPIRQLLITQNSISRSSGAL